MAARNVKSMPPPMRSRSALVIRLAMTPSLSDTLEPPRTTTYGRAGSSVALRSDAISPRGPACRPRAGGPARRRTPTPACGARRRSRRETKTSASSASSPASSARSASTLDVSRGSNRMFSSSAIWPSWSAATVSFAESPTTSVARATGWPRSSESRSATGLSEYLSSGAPLGRPRCAITTTRAPAAQERLQRRERRAHAAVVRDGGAVERHVEVGADEHALAAQVAEVLDGLHASSSRDSSRG